MSDYIKAYHNTWLSVLARPDKKLLGSWHSRCHKVNELIKDKDQAQEVCAALQILKTKKWL